MMELVDDTDDSRRWERLEHEVHAIESRLVLRCEQLERKVERFQASHNDKLEEMDEMDATVIQLTKREWLTVLDHVDRLTQRFEDQETQLMQLFRRFERQTPMEVNENEDQDVLMEFVATELEKQTTQLRQLDRRQTDTWKEVEKWTQKCRETRTLIHQTHDAMELMQTQMASDAKQTTELQLRLQHQWKQTTTQWNHRWQSLETEMQEQYNGLKDHMDKQLVDVVVELQSLRSHHELLATSVTGLRTQCQRDKTLLQMLGDQVLKIKATYVARAT